MPPTKKRKRLGTIRNQETLRPRLKTSSRIKKLRENNARKKKENNNKLKSSPNRSKSSKIVNPKKSNASVLRCLDFTDFTISFSPDETSNDSEQSRNSNANLPKKTTRGRNQPLPNASQLATRSRTNTVSQADSNRSTKRKCVEIEVDNIPTQSAKKVAVLSAGNANEERKVKRSNFSSFSANNEAEVFEKTSWQRESNSSKTFVKKLFSGSSSFIDETLPVRPSLSENILDETEILNMCHSKILDKIQSRKRRLSHSSTGSDGAEAVNISSLSESSTDDTQNAQVTTSFQNSSVKTETMNENLPSSGSIGEEEANTKNQACTRVSTSKIRRDLSSLVKKSALPKVTELKVIEEDDDVTVIKNVTPIVAEAFPAQKTVAIDEKSINICRKRTRKKQASESDLNEQLKGISDSKNITSSDTSSLVSAKKNPSLHSSDSEKKQMESSLGCIVYLGLGRPVHPAVYVNLKMQTSDLKIDSSWAKIAASAVQVPNRPPSISRFLVPIVYGQLEDLALKHFSTSCSRICNNKKQISSRKTVTRNERIHSEINKSLADNLEQASDGNEPSCSNASCCFHAGVSFLNDFSKAKKISYTEINRSGTICKIQPSDCKPVKNPKNRYIKFEECTNSTSSCDTSSIDSKLETYSSSNGYISEKSGRFLNLNHNPGLSARRQLSKKVQLRQARSNRTKVLWQKKRNQALAQSADSQKIDGDCNNLEKSQPNAESPNRFLRSRRKTSSFAAKFSGLMNRRIAPKFEDVYENKPDSDSSSVNPVPSRKSSDVPRKLLTSEKPYEFTIRMSKIGQKSYRSVLSRKKVTPFIFNRTSNSNSLDSADDEEDPSLQGTSEACEQVSKAIKANADCKVSNATVIGRRQPVRWKRRYKPLTKRGLSIVMKRIKATAKAKKAELLLSKAEIESEVKSVVQKMINYVSEKEIQDKIEIDYDDDFCPHSSNDEATATEDDKFADVATSDLITRPSERKDRCARELARLNVNVIKLLGKAEDEPTPSESSDFCLKESCKLGCICQALNRKAPSNLAHCSQESCIFDCVCGSDWSSVKSSSETPSILTPLMKNLQAKSSKSLAVKEFRETVFVSCNNTTKSEIFLNNTKRRNRKLPKKFEDHVISVGPSFPSKFFASNSVPIEDPEYSRVAEKFTKESSRIEDLHPSKLAKKSSVDSVKIEDSNSNRITKKSSVENTRIEAQNPNRLAKKSSVESAKIEDPNPNRLTKKSSVESTRIEAQNPNRLAKKSSLESIKIEDPNPNRMTKKSSVESIRIEAQNPNRLAKKSSVESVRIEDPDPNRLDRKSSANNICTESRIEELAPSRLAEKSLIESGCIEPKQLPICSNNMPSKTLRVVLQSLEDEPKNIFCMVHNRRNCLCLPQIHSKYGIQLSDGTTGNKSPSARASPKQSEPSTENTDTGSSARTEPCPSKFVSRNKQKSYLTFLLNQEHQRSASLFFKTCSWHTPVYGEFQMRNVSLKQLIHFIKYCKKTLNYIPTLCDLLRASLHSASNHIAIPSPGSDEKCFSGILEAKSYLQSSEVLPKALPKTVPENTSGSSEVSTANPYFESDEKEGSIISNVCSIAPEEFEKLGKKEEQDSMCDSSLPVDISTPFESDISKSSLSVPPPSSSPLNRDSLSNDSLNNILIDLLPAFKDRHQWFIFDLLQGFEMVKVSIRSNAECVLQKCLKRQLFDKMSQKAQLRNKTIRYSFEDRIFSVFAVPGLPSLVFFGPFMRNDSMNLMPLQKSSPSILRMVPLKEIFVKYKLPRTQTVFDFTLVHQEIKSATEEMLAKSREQFIYYYFWEPLQNPSQTAVPPPTSSDVIPTSLTDVGPTESVTEPALASTSVTPEVNLPASNEHELKVEAAPSALPPCRKLLTKKRKPMPKSKRSVSSTRNSLTLCNKGKSAMSAKEKCRHILRIQAEHSYVSSFSGANSTRQPVEPSSTESNSKTCSSIVDKEPEFSTGSTGSNLENEVNEKESVGKDLSVEGEQSLENESSVNITEMPQTLSETNEEDSAPPGFISKYLLCSVKEVGYVDVFASTTSSVLIVNLSYMELNFDNITQASDWLNNALGKCLIFFPVDFKPQWQLVQRCELPKKCKMFDPQRLSKYTFLTEEGPKVKTTNAVTAESDTESTASVSDDFEPDIADVCEDSSESTTERGSKNEQKDGAALNELLLDEQTGLLSETITNQSNQTKTNQSEKNIAHETDQQSEETEESKTCELNHHSQTGKSENSVDHLKTKDPLNGDHLENFTDQLKTKNPLTCEDVCSDRSQIGDQSENIDDTLTTEDPLACGTVSTVDDEINDSSQTGDLPECSLEHIKQSEETEDPLACNSGIIVDPEVSYNQQKRKSEVATKSLNQLSPGKLTLVTKLDHLTLRNTLHVKDKLKTPCKATSGSNSALNNDGKSASCAQTSSHDGNNASKSNLSTYLQNFRPILPNLKKNKMQFESSNSKQDIAPQVAVILPANNQNNTFNPVISELTSNRSTNASKSTVNIARSGNTGISAKNSDFVVSQKTSTGGIIIKLEEDSRVPSSGNSLKIASKPGVNGGDKSNVPTAAVSSTANNMSKIVVGSIGCLNSAAGSSLNASSKSACPLSSTSAEHSSIGTQGSPSNRLKPIPIPVTLASKPVGVSNSQGPQFESLTSLNRGKFIIKQGTTDEPQVVRIESVKGIEPSASPSTTHVASSSADPLHLPEVPLEIISEGTFRSSPFSDSNKFEEIIMPDGDFGQVHTLSPTRKHKKQKNRVTRPMVKRLDIMNPFRALSRVAASRAIVLQNALKEVNRCSRERDKEEKPERRRKRGLKRTGKGSAPASTEQPNKEGEKETTAGTSSEDEGNQRKKNRKRKAADTEEKEVQEERQETSHSDYDPQIFKSSEEKLLKERRRRRELYVLAQELLAVAMENTLDVDYPSSSAMSLQAVLKLAMLAIDKQKVESEMMTIDHGLLRERNTALRERLLTLQNGCESGGEIVRKNPTLRTFISETTCIQERLRKRIRTRNEKVLKLAIKVNTILEQDPDHEEWNCVNNLMIHIPKRRA